MHAGKLSGSLASMAIKDAETSVKACSSEVVVDHVLNKDNHVNIQCLMEWETSEPAVRQLRGLLMAMVDQLEIRGSGLISVTVTLYC